MNPHVLQQQVVRAGVGDDSVLSVVIYRKGGIARCGHGRRSILDALRMTSKLDASNVNKLRSAEVEDKAHPKPAVELGHGA